MEVRGRTPIGDKIRDLVRETHPRFRYAPPRATCELTKLRLNGVVVQRSGSREWSNAQLTVGGFFGADLPQQVAFDDDFPFLEAPRYRHRHHNDGGDDNRSNYQIKAPARAAWRRGFFLGSGGEFGFCDSQSSIVRLP